jgi:hypothetical protein
MELVSTIILIRKRTQKLRRYDRRFSDWEYVQVKGRKTLGWISQKLDGMVWTEFTWLRVGANDTLKITGLHNMRIS